MRDKMCEDCKHRKGEYCELFDDVLSYDKCIFNDEE